ncbi:hypothetical protein ASF56_22990 [Methylobacterium sp. Leaf122]|nr:DUF305 domain-containing protein [Methylobacterium sp. Leaf122]KQQ17590.1 hypothetical protein ASF56_22990 [Methylobacterium sp. Leaf122]
MKLALAASALALLLSGAVAQAHDTNQTGHAGHDAMTATDKTDSPATKAFRDVDAEMHRDMDIRYTNDVDTDFVRGMIPHHKGAIGMAKVALQYSKDPEIRKLAEEIIKAQEVEISQMQEFLKRKNAAK